MRAPSLRLLGGLPARLAAAQAGPSSCSSLLVAQQASANTWQPQQLQQQHGPAQLRCFGAEAAPEPEAAGSDDDEPVANAKVRQLADEIVGLTVLESSWLSDILRKRLNIQRPAFGGGGFAAFAPAPGGAAASAPVEAAPVEKKEQTEFNVKLESFSPEGKIKVIKEVRVITALGLKEAKELVEKSPVVVKTGLSRADAEALQKSLEAAGGKVVLE